MVCLSHELVSTHRARIGCQVADRLASVMARNLRKARPTCRKKGNAKPVSIECIDLGDDDDDDCQVVITHPAGAFDGTVIQTYRNKLKHAYLGRADCSGIVVSTAVVERSEECDTPEVANKFVGALAAAMSMQDSQDGQGEGHSVPESEPGPSVWPEANMQVMIDSSDSEGEDDPAKPGWQPALLMVGNTAIWSQKRAMLVEATPEGTSSGSGVRPVGDTPKEAEETQLNEDGGNLGSSAAKGNGLEEQLLANSS